MFWQNAPQHYAGEQFNVEYTFLSEPSVRYGNQVFTVNGILVYAPELPDFTYGDKVRIEGIITEKVQASKQNNRVTKILVLKNPRINNLNQNNLLIASAARVRNVVTRNFHDYLGNDEAALLLGIVFGIKENISQVLYTGFKNTDVCM